MKVKTIGEHANAYSQLSPSNGCEKTQQIEIRDTEKTTEMERASLWRSTYIPINWHIPPKKTNKTNATVIFRGARCNGMVANQEHSHSTTPTDNIRNE